MCERGVPERRGDVISPEHPAQVVPELPESLPHQAVSAPTPSFPEVSLSIVNMKSKKNPNKQTPQISCSQISAWWKEGRKMLFVLVHTLPNLSLSSFIQEFI